MDSQQSIDYNAALQNPLFSNWLEYTQNPGCWIDTGRISRLLTQDSNIQKHTGEINIHPSLLAHSEFQIWLSNTLAPKPCPWSLFNLPLTPMLFMSKNSIARLCAALGALSYQINSDSLIEKESLNQIRHQLDDFTFRYVVKTGPLLLTSLPELFKEIRERTTFWDSSQKELIDLTAVGQCILFKAISYVITKNIANTTKANNFIETWINACQLKFPFEHDDAANALYKSLSALATQQVVVVISKLIRHLEPRCKHLLN